MWQKGKQFEKKSTKRQIIFESNLFEVKTQHCCWSVEFSFIRWCRFGNVIWSWTVVFSANIIVLGHNIANINLLNLELYNALFLKTKQPLEILNIFEESKLLIEVVVFSKKSCSHVARCDRIKASVYSFFFS